VPHFWPLLPEVGFLTLRYCCSEVRNVETAALGCRETNPQVFGARPPQNFTFHPASSVQAAHLQPFLKSMTDCQRRFRALGSGTRVRARVNSSLLQFLDT